MAFLVPVTILPYYISNRFETPKSLIIMLGVSILIFANYEKLKNIPFIVKALILFNVVNLFYSENIYYTKIAVILNVSCLLVYYFSSMITDIYKIMQAVMISGLAVSVYAWFQFFGDDPKIISTIGNSNFLGAYLIFPLFASIGLMFHMKHKVLYGCASLIIFSALLFARARGAWVGFFFGIMILIWKWKAAKIQKLLFVMTGIIILSSVWLFSPVQRQGLYDEAFSTGSLSIRVKGYALPAVKMWLKSPIIGRGMWSYRKLVYEYQSKIGQTDGTYYTTKNMNPKPRRAHNDWLETLVDGGIIGFILCAVFIIRGIFIFFAGFNSDNKLGLSCLCAIVAILVDAFFFFPFRVNSTLFMTCLTFGLMEGSCKIYQEDHF